MTVFGESVSSVNYMAHLLSEGYVVVPLGFDVVRQLDSIRQQIDHFLDTMPELKPRGERPPNALRVLSVKNTGEQNLQGGPMYVRGGFSAIGTPSSFHCPLVRRLRQWAMHAALEHVFILLSNGLRVEQIVDRLMVRPPGAKVSAESWHRDEAPNARPMRDDYASDDDDDDDNDNDNDAEWIRGSSVEPGGDVRTAETFRDPEDTVFGGWVNLNDSPQFFTCAPNSHTYGAPLGPRPETGGGFVPIPRGDYGKYAEVQTRVEIPAGHMLIFYERLAHIVTPATTSQTQYRLFTGWNLTTRTASNPLVSDVLRRLDEQDWMPLKSNQYPAMYPVLAWTNQPLALSKWSEAWADKVCQYRTVGSGPNSGTVYRVVRGRTSKKPLAPDDQMPSLEELNAKYDEYTDDEIAMLVPGDSWLLLKPGHADVYESIALPK